ncbi:hypothetical protein CC86DRAFT_463553 [Ophiobolus disseminans]|uniref:Uncharacterized protein n=1 Tax=Ophiobolus disseminans TaxID=1469910 RepID=A0A6A7AGE1_9PLEO|nr:hypothetical protein CC86DRAFT_463553 [Ophiobolus disseminans]
MGPPKNAWKMFTYVPWSGDRAAVDEQIAKVEIKVGQEEAAGQDESKNKGDGEAAPQGNKRRADAISEEGEGPELQRLKTKYPGGKLQTSRGAGPDIGASWERSVFGFRPTFMKAVLIYPGDNHKNNRAHDLLIAQVRNESRSDTTVDPGVSSVKLEDEKYRVTTAYRFHERELLPTQWLASWFQQSHWEPEEKTREEICAPPNDVWNMYTEGPSPDDRNAIDDQVGRVRIEKTKRVEPDEMEGNDSKKRSLDKVRTLGDTPETQRFKVIA